MWEDHRVGIGRYAGFPADRGRQPGGIHTQQDQIRAAGVQPVGRQMHLLRRGKVDETGGVEGVGSMLTAGGGQLPVLSAAQVDQDGRGRIHTASLPAPQHGTRVRHDTPREPPGNKAGTENV